MRASVCRSYETALLARAYSSATDKLFNTMMDDSKAVTSRSHKSFRDVVLPLFNLYDILPVPVSDKVRYSAAVFQDWYPLETERKSRYCSFIKYHTCTLYIRNIKIIFYNCKLLLFYHLLIYYFPRERFVIYYFLYLLYIIYFIKRKRKQYLSILFSSVSNWY